MKIGNSKNSMCGSSLSWDPPPGLSGPRSPEGWLPVSIAAPPGTACGKSEDACQSSPNPLRRYQSSISLPSFRMAQNTNRLEARQLYSCAVYEMTLGLPGLMDRSVVGSKGQRRQSERRGKGSRIWQKEKSNCHGCGCKQI